MNSYRIFKKSFLLLVLLSPFIFLSSCTKSTDDLPDNSSIQQNLNTTDGWIVSYYFDKDKEETGDFNGFVFYFRDNGEMEAVSNGDIRMGTWRIISDDGFQKLVITFSSGYQPLEDLVDDWIILVSTDDKIELRDDNDDHLEELHFKRL